MKKNEIIIKVDKGEKLDELRDDLIEVLNRYSNLLTGYEMVGVLDVVRNDAHKSIERMDEEGE